MIIKQFGQKNIKHKDPPKTMKHPQFCKYCGKYYNHKIKKNNHINTTRHKKKEIAWKNLEKYYVCDTYKIEW